MLDLTEAIKVKYEDGTCEEAYGTSENAAGLLLCTYNYTAEDSGTEFLRIIKEYRHWPEGAETVMFYIEFRSKKPLKFPRSIEIPMCPEKDGTVPGEEADSMPLCGKWYSCETAENVLYVNTEAGCPDEFKGPVFVSTISGSRALSRRLSILSASERMKKKWWRK